MSKEFQRLSEGYDFIEEACGCSVPLIFSEENYTIAESVGEKSPYKILGKACGVFQEVGGFSRNNRYYPPEHWPRLLENLDVQERISGRKMLGMIGHDDSRISDLNLREGLVSHVVSKLEIREDENAKPYLYGELEILDTPAGRILKGLYEGGVGLHVSSRGAGKLLDTPGQTYKTVAPQFFLEGFDIVLNPGFVCAKPVYENVSKDSNIQESAPLTQSADPALAESVEQVQPEQTQANEDLSHLSSQVDKLARILEKVVNDVYETEEQLVEEATNMEKVFDLDNKINNVEKIRKQEYEKTISAEGKPWTEVSKSQARVEQADNLLKRLKKSRKEALGESQASLISALALIKEANISEELMVDIVELIKKGLK